jgi:hypothetical protein
MTGRQFVASAAKSQMLQRVLIGIGVLVLVAALSAWFFLRPIPDVRGNVPLAEKNAWIQPLLDAGYCVRFHYDASATSFERDGKIQATADSYVIGGESPGPGSRRLPGTTVTVIVGGSSLSGPSVGWDSMPISCP